MFLLQGCCSIISDLLNKNTKTYKDYRIDNYENPQKPYLEFGLYVRKDAYKYKTDSLNPRLKYIFEILAPKLPPIKLNAITFTRKIDRDTIPLKLYYDTAYLKQAAINDLPFIIIKDHSGIKIIAESSESYYQTKKIYISYDIEIGEERIIRKNIEYKRKLQVDCQPRW